MVRGLSIFERRNWLARVLQTDAPVAKPCGSAILIDEYHLLTCAHVVLDAGAKPGQHLSVDFPQRPGIGPVRAEVLEEGWRAPAPPPAPQSDLDCALLRLDTPSAGVEALPIVARESCNALSFEAYGFPEHLPEGDAARGHIQRLVGNAFVRLVANETAQIEPAFSGTATWAPEIGAAVGIVVSRKTGDGCIAFAIPIVEIAPVMPTVQRVLDRASTTLDWLDHVPATLLEDVTKFTHVIKDRTTDFTGRNWVFDAINARMQSTDRGYILIRGEPGIGKSSIMARLVEKSGWPHHFNIAPQNIRSAARFLRNVCAQLIVRHGLTDERLPASVGNDSSFLSDIFSRASAGRDAPVVLLVDALDEAETPPAGVNRLCLPRELPLGVFIIATLRTGTDAQIDSPHLCDDIIVAEDGESNRADVRAYISGFLARNQMRQDTLLAPWDGDRDAFVEEASVRSEGNFMYLRHVLSDLAAGKLSTFDIGIGQSPLPRGLSGYYQRHWDEMQAGQRDRFRHHHKPVLAYFAIAREPVTADMIAKWINEDDALSPIDAFEIEDLLEAWAEFFQVVPGAPQKYQLYHQSFLDFLDGKLRLNRYRRRQVQATLKKIDFGSSP